MKRLSVFFVAAVMAAALCTDLLQAQPRGNFRGDRDRPQMRKEIAEELGLSGEQKEKIQQIRLEARKQAIAHRAKVQLAHIELQELLQADNPDQNKINAKISEVSKLHETGMRNRIATQLDVQKVLTPEQRKKAQELRPFRGMRDYDDFEGRPGPGMHRGMRMQGMPDIMPFEE